MDDARRFTARAATRSFFELFGLTGLAVTQPILDVFGRAPEAFIAHDAGRGDVIAFALVITLVPTLVLWAVVSVAGLVSPAAGRLAQIGAVAGLVALFVLQVLKEVLGVDGVVLGLLAALAGVGTVFAYRVPAVRQSLVYLALAPVLFVGAFLVTSPTSDLLRSADVDAADIGDGGSDRSVVMIVWDEWPLNSILDRTGAIDEDLFPNLAALAADGAFYRNATTVASATTSAVPALVTGRYATDGASPTAADHPENLFTLLANEYDLEVTESATALCPDALCDGPFVDDPEAAEAAGTEDLTSGGSALGELVEGRPPELPRDGRPRRRRRRPGGDRRGHHDRDQPPDNGHRRRRGRGRGPQRRHGGHPLPGPPAERVPPLPRLDRAGRGPRAALPARPAAPQPLSLPARRPGLRRRRHRPRRAGRGPAGPRTGALRHRLRPPAPAAAGRVRRPAGRPAHEPAAPDRALPGDHGHPHVGPRQGLRPGRVAPGLRRRRPRRVPVPRPPLRPAHREGARDRAGHGERRQRRVHRRRPHDRRRPGHRPALARRRAIPARPPADQFGEALQQGGHGRGRLGGLRRGGRAGPDDHLRR